MAPDTLARRAARAREPTRAWCEAAAGLGILRASAGGKFSVEPHLRAALTDESSLDYMAGHFSYLALRSLDFAGFDELFRDGRPSAREQRHLVEAFAQATAWDHTAFLALVPPAVPALRKSLERGGEVLDVGCGTGAWCFRVARAFPRARFRGVDADPVPLRRARGRARALGLERRVSFDAGAVEALPYHERFDLVHLGEVLCGAGQDAAMLSACRRALKPGGHLVVAEGLVDERAGPNDSGNVLVRAMQLEFALQPARFRTRRELASALGRAGFARPEVLPAGGGFFFAVAAAPGGAARPSRGPTRRSRRGR